MYPVYYCLLPLILFTGGADVNRSRHVIRAAAPGQTVLLPCVIVISTSTWRYHSDSDRHRDHDVSDNGVLAEEYAGRFQLDASGLLIRDVQPEDQGTYTCVDHRNHTCGIQLYVPCRKKYVQIGQPVILECDALLYPHVVWRYTSPYSHKIRTVYWRGRIYTKDRNRFQIQPQDGVFDIVINRVNVSDAGIYRCQENDGQHPGEACTELIVNAPSNSPSATTAGSSKGSIASRSTGKAGIFIVVSIILSLFVFSCIICVGFLLCIVRENRNNNNQIFTDVLLAQ